MVEGCHHRASEVHRLVSDVGSRRSTRMCLLWGASGVSSYLDGPLFVSSMTYSWCYHCHNAHYIQTRDGERVCLLCQRKELPRILVELDVPTLIDHFCPHCQDCPGSASSQDEVGNYGGNSGACERCVDSLFNLWEQAGFPSASDKAWDHFKQRYEENFPVLKFNMKNFFLAHAT